MTIKNISKKTINTYLQKLQEQGDSFSLILKKLSIIDKFLTWAYQKNLIEKDTFKQIKEEIDTVKSKVKSQKSKVEDKKLKAEAILITESKKTTPSIVDFEKAVYTGEKKTEGFFGEISLRFHLQTYKIKSFLLGLLKRVPLLDSRFRGNDKEKINDKEEIKEKKPTAEFDISNLGIHHYIGFLFLLIFLGFLGAGLYNKFFLKVERPLAYPLTLTRGGRVLSFQGRLTDSLGNPITTSTNVQFKLYNVSTGGTPLYTAGPCSIVPDQDGIFSVLIGSQCGAEIPHSVFTENPNVYLGVTVGADSEMTPRQPIANVGYAINAETLQGFPPGTSTSNIPFINQDGDLLIAVASPGIRSTFTSADFTLSSARTAIIQSAGTGDVVLQATESGALKFRTGGTTDAFNQMVINNNGNIGIGVNNPAYKLDVQGGDINVSGNLRTGGTVRIDSSGNLSNIETISSTYLTTGASFVNVAGASTVFQMNGTTVIDTSRNVVNVGNITGSGVLTLGANPATSGQIRLPNNVWITARNADNTGDVNMIQINSSNLVAFGANLAAFTLGGDVTGNNRTISGLGQLTVDNIRLDGNTIDSTSGGLTVAVPTNQTLTLSAPGAGHIILSSDDGNVGIGTNSPSQKLSIAGTFGILEGGTSPTYYTIFQGGDQTGNITYTLPTSIVADGFLKTDGSGVLSWTTDISANSLKWNALTHPDGNLNLNHSTYTTTFNTGVTTENFFTINANSLTSGKGLYLSSTATGLTGNLAEFVLSGSNSGNTGNVVRIAQTGTSSAAVPLMITNLGTGLSFRVNDETGDNDSTPFVIDASGNVGIGTTGPEQRLHVVGNLLTTGGLYSYGGSFSTQNIINYEYDGLFAADKRWTVTLEGFDSSANMFDARPETWVSCSTLPCSVEINFGGVQHYWYAFSLSYLWGTDYAGSSSFLIEKFVDSTSPYDCADASWSTVANVTGFSGYRYMTTSNLGSYICRFKITFNNIVGSQGRIDLGEIAAYRFYYNNEGPLVKRYGDTLYGGLNFAGVTNDITTPGTEHLALMPGGNVGIGTTAPENSVGWNRVLDVYGNSHSRIITRTNSIRTAFTSHNSGYYGAPAGGIIGTETSHSLSFITGGSSRVTIDSAGNVGIGTTGPNYKLDVANGAIVSNYPLGHPWGIGIRINNAWTGGWVRQFAFFSNAGTQMAAFLAEGAGDTISRVAIGQGLNSAGVEGTSWININPTTGNVGIGTTSPSSKLHVVGECVVGDTLLPIKRRRKRRQGEDDKEDEFEDLLVPIKDVKEKDLVASFDEQKEEITYRPIKALMYKGIQKIFRVTTEDGRKIETTENHPYLTENKGWLKVCQLKVGMRIAVPEKKTQKTVYAFVDASNLMYAAKRVGWKMDYEKLASYLRYRFGVSRLLFYGGVDQQNKKQLNFYRKLKEFGYELKLIPVKRFFSGEKKADVDSLLTFEAMKYAAYYDKAIFITGDEDYYQMFKYLFKQKEVILLSHKHNTAIKLKQLFKPRFTDLGELKETLQLKANEDKKMGRTRLSYSSRGLMGKVYQKSPDLSRGKIKFVAIASIEEVGRKEVFDIEVEGTHNFVGNDIIAHNTYIQSTATTANIKGLEIVQSGAVSGTGYGLYVSKTGASTTNVGGYFSASGGTNNYGLIVENGSVGIGTTSPSSFKLQVDGSVGPNVDNTYNLGSPSLKWANIYVSNIYLSGFNPGSVIFAGSSGQLSQNNSQFFWDNNNARLGIGTTTPAAKLDVNGTLSVRSYATVSASLSVGTFDAPAGPGHALFSGKVGIGTHEIDKNIGDKQPQLIVKGNVFGGAFIDEESGYIYGLDPAGNTLPNGNSLFIANGAILAANVGNVGIGTTNPDNNRLRIVGTTNDNTAFGLRVDNLEGTGLIVVRNDGNVGIGTTNPQSRLHVSVPSGTTQLAAQIQNLQNDPGAHGLLINTTNTSTSTYALDVQSGGTSRLYVRADGNVGIGTTEPFSRLGVVGGLIYTGDANTRFGAQISGDDEGRGVFGSNLYIGSDGQFRTFGSHASYGYSAMDARWGELRFYTQGEGTTQDAIVTPTPRMIIDTNGNVGIGTTAPGRKLQVAGTIYGSGSDASWTTSNWAKRIELATGGVIQWLKGAGTISRGIGLTTDNKFYFIRSTADDSSAAATYDMVIDGGGNVGIGTTSPGYKLDVAGPINLNKGLSGIAMYVNGSEALWYNGTYFSWGYGGTANFFADSVGIGTTGPSYKLHVMGDIYADGGWLRTSGSAGWYSESYGGGWYMIDNTWIRTYSSKSVWTGGGLLGSQAGLTIGYGGVAPPSGGAIISGNVGIGTMSPGARLDVAGTTYLGTGQTTWGWWNESIRFTNTSNAAITFPAGGLLFGLHSDRHFYWANTINDTYTMILSNAGNLYLGSNTFIAGSTGNSYFNAGRVGMGATTFDIRTRLKVTSPVGGIYEDWPSVWGGGIATWDIVGASTYFTAYITRSDASIKKDIKPLNNNQNILDKILALNPVSYYWKDERIDKDKHFGFIAQEVEEVIPEIVKTDVEGKKSLNYNELIPFLVKAIQQQQLQLNSNTTRLSSLEEDLNLTSTGDLEIKRTNGNEEYVYDGILNLENQISNIKNQNYILKIKNEINETVDRIGTFAEMVAAKIKVGLLEAESAIVNNILVVKNIVAENIQSLTLNVERLTTSQKITSPVIETKNIEFKNQNPKIKITDQKAKLEIVDSQNQPIAQFQTDEKKTVLTGEVEVVSSQEKGKLAQIILKNLEGKTAVTIDASGNASFSGTLFAQNIISNQGNLNNLTVNQDASISGKLIAKEVEAENINEIQRLLAEIKNQPLPDLNNQTNLSTTANLSNLTVTNQTNLYNVSVSGSLLIGQTLLENNSILALASELKLSSLEKITLFDGAVNIAKDGTITTKGTLIAQGGIKTKRIILPEDNPQLTIENSKGDVLASIDASGSAYFKNIALEKFTPATPEAALIAAPENFAKNGIFAPAIEASASAAGVAIIPKNSQEVVIYSSSAKPTSLIYLTPKTHQPLSLSILEKKEGYFRVIRRELLDQDISFDWLIIN